MHTYIYTYILPMPRPITRSSVPTTDLQGMLPLMVEAEGRVHSTHACPAFCFNACICIESMDGHI